MLLRPSVNSPDLQMPPWSGVLLLEATPKRAVAPRASTVRKSLHVGLSKGLQSLRRVHWRMLATGGSACFWLEWHLVSSALHRPLRNPQLSLYPSCLWRSKPAFQRLPCVHVRCLQSTLSTNGNPTASSPHKGERTSSCPVAFPLPGWRRGCRNPLNPWAGRPLLHWCCHCGCLRPTRPKQTRICLAMSKRTCRCLEKLCLQTRGSWGSARQLPSRPRSQLAWWPSRKTHTTATHTGK